MAGLWHSQGWLPRPRAFRFSPLFRPLRCRPQPLLTETHEETQQAACSPKAAQNDLLTQSHFTAEQTEATRGRHLAKGFEPGEFGFKGCILNPCTKLPFVKTTTVT